ncbi:PseG/SpsG family protein [Actinoplanes rectilineatus]|uniref:PseG/SpsG family protein n=1 Tax=Actinoplanes rectilineatus TaxID=113571 RepID=UPI0005F2E64E|nr:spore coat protein [Actinoplanes rectilineatus]
MTVIGIRCDAGTRTGVGHLIRCVALAEELTARGADVHFLADLGGLAWAEAQLRQRGLAWHPAPFDAVGLVAATRRLGLDALVIDSYTLSPEQSVAVRAAGLPTLAIVDGDPRGQSADIYVDQNLDAVLDHGDVRLAGLDYALLRSSVRHLRPRRQPVHAATRTPRIVAFFGGTDAFRAAPQVARLLTEVAAPFHATVIAADESLRAELLAVRAGPGQRFEIIDPTDHLPELLVDADLVISASGTSTWELLCLGRAAALLWVVDNQIPGYERTVARGFAAGIGRLGDFDPRAADVLRELLTDPAARTDLAGRGWAAVDGRGVERVADALLSASDRK